MKNSQKIPSTNLEENSAESPISFETQTESDEIKILGELLSGLRNRKEMSLLMLCRQIKAIKVENNVAEIDLDEEFQSQVMENEMFVRILNDIFSGLGLTFRFKGKKVQSDGLVELNKMLGGKLKFK